MGRAATKRKRQSTLTRGAVAVSVPSGPRSGPSRYLREQLRSEVSSSDPAPPVEDLAGAYREWLERPAGPYEDLVESLRSAASLLRQNQQPAMAEGRLQLIAAVNQVVEAWLPQLVAEARSEGTSWASVGGALGIAKQSAWSRFGGEDG